MEVHTVQWVTSRMLRPFLLYSLWLEPIDVNNAGFEILMEIILQMFYKEGNAFSYLPQATSELRTTVARLESLKIRAKAGRYAREVSDHDSSAAG